MGELRPPKRSLRAIPKLSFLRRPEIPPPSEDRQSFRLSKGMRILFGAGATGLFAGLVVGSFSASGVIDMTLAIALLTAAWIVGVVAVFVSEPLFKLAPKIKWPIGIAVSAILAAILGGIGYYENAHFPSEKPKDGARFTIAGSNLKKGDSKIILTVTDRGDLDARVWANGSGIIFPSNHLLSENEEDQALKEARSRLPMRGTGVEFLKGGSRTIELDFSITDAQYDAVLSGSLFLYVVFVMAFTDSATPANTHWVAEYCVKYFKKLEDSTVCLGHNETRLPG